MISCSLLSSKVSRKKKILQWPLISIIFSGTGREEVWFYSSMNFLYSLTWSSELIAILSKTSALYLLFLEARVFPLDIGLLFLENFDYLCCLVTMFISTRSEGTSSSPSLLSLYSTWVDYTFLGSSFIFSSSKAFFLPIIWVSIFWSRIQARERWSYVGFAWVNANSPRSLTIDSTIS